MKASVGDKEHHLLSCIGGIGHRRSCCGLATIVISASRFTFARVLLLACTFNGAITQTSWGCTTKNLSRRQWFGLRDHRWSIPFVQYLGGLDHCSAELHRAHYEYLGALLAGGTEAVDKMLDVYADFHKHVQALDDSFGDGDQAGVSVVNEEVTSQSLGRQVVHATRTIRDISEYAYALTTTGLCKGLQDVAKTARIHKQPLRQLQGNMMSLGLIDAMDGLGDLKLVVAGQGGRDGVEEGGILTDAVGDVGLERATSRALLANDAAVPGLCIFFG